MNEDEVWAAIDTQRLRTVDLLESLSAEEWAHPSLCDGWTVRDVAAHLTLQQISLGDGLRMALRHPGSIKHINRENARMRAGLPTERLIADIRGMVGSRRHNFGLTHLETLIDIVVHGQDIAIPLSRELEVDLRSRSHACGRITSPGGVGGRCRSFAACPTSATGSPPPTPNGLSVRVPRFAGRSSPS